MTLKRMTHRNYRTLGRCVINPPRFGVGAFLRHPPGEKSRGKKLQVEVDEVSFDRRNMNMKGEFVGSAIIPRATV
jgi:hypothetical protein